MPERTEFIGYRPRLDGLRTVAIGFVLIEHFGKYLFDFVKAGYYGVDLFFVISGFLITSILIKNEGESFSGSYKKFIGRRALRIFPIYYLTISLLWIADAPSAREMFPWLSTYTYNYGVILTKGQNEIPPLFYLWSLSVEEQFYLFWPLLAISLRHQKKTLIAVTALLVFASYAQLTLHMIPTMVPFNYTGLFTRMGSLGLGALGAIYLASGFKPGGVLFKSVWFEIAMLLLLALSISLTFRGDVVLMGLGSAFLVIKAATVGFRLPLIDRFLLNQKVIYVGSVSYGIYLFHVPLGAWMTQNVFDPIWLSFAWDQFGAWGALRWHSWVIKLPLYTAVSVALAALSYRIIEAPILTFKDRWFRYGSPKSVEAAV